VRAEPLWQARLGSVVQHAWCCFIAKRVVQNFFFRMGLLTEVSLHARISRVFLFSIASDHGLWAHDGPVGELPVVEEGRSS